MNLASDTFTSLMETRWSQLRVLVIGDVMLDKYVHGQVERVSPEAPVPVVRVVRSHQQPGGAANVAMNIASLGARVQLLGFTGDDADRGTLLAALKSAAVSCHLVAVPGRPTTSKLRILGGQQQIVRLDSETTSAPAENACKRLLDAFDALLPASDVVLLSDYAKGALTPRVCRYVIDACRRAGLPVLVDPKARDFARYAGADCICPNAAELAAATGAAADDEEALFTQGRQLLELHGLGHLVVTQGERGITVLSAKGRWHAPSVAQQVFDVSGAGDTVIAVLALCVAAGLSPEDAAPLCNLAAGVAVSKLGTVAVTRAEVLEAMAAAEGDRLHEKILSPQALAERVRRWRAAGDTLVFTNGCFDLLHAGHISLLQQCRCFGTRLIVGLNSDASVAALKGPARPIVGQAERARMLAALAVCDGVAVFDAPTPIDLINAIRPDVLVKGGDYAEHKVVGAPEVRSWGGRVELVPLVTGLSTSALVQRIQSRQASLVA